MAERTTVYPRPPIAALLGWLALAGCHAPRPTDDPPPRLARPPERTAPPAPASPQTGTRPVTELPFEPAIDPVLLGAWPADGPRVDLEEHRTPVRRVLERFARLSRLNFVVSDDVRGEVTTSLRGVPWPRALAVVLRALNLVAVREGSVVRVLTRQGWQAEVDRGG